MNRLMGAVEGLMQLVTWVSTGLIILLLHDWLITAPPKHVPTVKPVIIAWMAQ